MAKESISIHFYRRKYCRIISPPYNTVSTFQLTVFVHSARLPTLSAHADSRTRLNTTRTSIAHLLTSSSSLSIRLLSNSTSCRCSCSRYLASKISSAFDRSRHSKCRSRSSYCLRTSLRRSLVLRELSTSCVSYEGNLRTRHRILLPSLSSPCTLY